jgi:ankyrin repeat protein
VTVTIRLAAAIVVGAFGCLAGGTAAAEERPPLVAAMKRLDRGAVRDLLRRGADVNAAEADGTTALHWASHHDDLEMAGLLVDAGARVNAANDLGATPLWSASLNRSIAMVSRLLRAGADPNAALLLGETPLMVAARAGSPAVVAALLEAGARVDARAPRGQTALMWAAAQRHADVVGVLLAHGADVHARSDVWSQVMGVSPHGHPDHNRDIPHGGDTALMFAARVGDLPSARLLVAAGAHVNDADAWGVSALVMAAHAGHDPLVEFLLERGADPNAAAAGFTALHAAVMRRSEPMARALLARGADPNIPLRTWTPTRRTSRDWNFDPPLVGASPLWLAARFTAPGVVRLLLQHGADPRFVHHADYVVDGRGGTAYTRRRESTTTLLAAAGLGGGTAWVQPEAGSREALMLETIALLVEMGADVNAAAADGRTVLDLVRALKYERAVKYLADRGARPGTKKENAR